MEEKKFRKDCDEGFPFLGVVSSRLIGTNIYSKDGSFVGQMEGKMGVLSRK